MPEDEQPPPEIWHDDEAIKEWFEVIEAKRKERHTPASERVETVPMDDNELTRQYRVK